VQRVESHARADGALVVLQTVLLGRAKSETRAGNFPSAEMTYDEVVELTRLIGGPADFYELLKADLYAWRGMENDTRAAAKVLRDAASVIGSASAVNIADLAVGTLELGMGRYAEALAAVVPMVEANMPGWTCFALPIAVEGAARSGEQQLAEGYVEQLRVRTESSGRVGASVNLLAAKRCSPMETSKGCTRRQSDHLRRHRWPPNWRRHTSVTASGCGGKDAKRKPGPSFAVLMTCW
jgi:hypothetical protein